MTRERPWARHYLEVWQERAGDDRYPYWLRVAALAYGSHLDNGHARFKRGEIAMILGRIDPATGELVPYRNVSRAIVIAVEYGWLDPASFWGCLVVPAHAIKKGEHGRDPVCPIHAKRRREGKESPAEARESTLSERFKPRKPTLTERFEPSRAHSVSGSEREPLSSLLHRSARTGTTATDHRTTLRHTESDRRPRNHPPTYAARRRKGRQRR